MQTPRSEVTFILLHGLLCDGDTWSHLAGPLSRLGTVQIPCVSGITSIPQAATDILAQMPQRRMQLVDAAQAGGIQAIVDPWLAGMITLHTADDAALMNALRSMVLRSTPVSFAGQIRALVERPDATEMLGRIACPTLLLSGDEDTWSPLSRHHDMAALIPEAEVTAIPRAGHMAPFEAPEACNAAILGWLLRQGWA